VHSVRWDTGEQIAGTPFRELIPAGATDSAFSCHSALIQPHRLVVPHTHTKEDEFSFVYRGQLGARIGEDDLLVEEGGLLFQPRNVLHALWNPTDVEVVLLVFITPPGFEGFFRDMGALDRPADPERVHDINTRYGHISHAELIPELTSHYAVVP
jgi:mannose-6-phosphate isomerase-like protein (cupin superfamily)